MTRAGLGLVILLAGCGGKAPERSGQALFRDVAAESGLVFTHVNGATGEYYMPEIMGAGCALLDYDGDGDLDVFLVQGGAIGGGGVQGPGNRLFRNDLIPSGALRFTDVTAEAGLAHSGYGMGAATGDFNNDGRVDLLVTGFGGNVLYRNDDGRFTDVTAESPGVRMDGSWSTSAAFFDYDRDGWQDLVILRYADFSVQGNKRCTAPTGEPDYCTPVAYRAVPARLFHNEHGRFRDVTAAAGLDRAAGSGLGVAAIDFNQDGWPDLFVANDTAANHLWTNQRNGTLREQAIELGVAYAEDGLAKAGMGVAAGDFDNDGDEDLVVLNLMREGATLFRNDFRQSGFSDVSRATGLHALTYLFTGFGTGWIDYDNDGRLDLFLANGAVTRREEQRGELQPFRERKLLLRNDASGRFVDVTAQAGQAFEALEVSRGAAFGDVDNDGRVDILVTNNGGPARLLRNEGPRGHWVGVALEGPGLGIGARVGVVREGGSTAWQRVRTDSSYLSASDSRVHLGLGEGAGVRAVVVEWPGGRRQEYRARVDAFTRIKAP